MSTGIELHLRPDLGREVLSVAHVGAREQHAGEPGQVGSDQLLVDAVDALDVAVQGDRPGGAQPRPERLPEVGGGAGQRQRQPRGRAVLLDSRIREVQVQVVGADQVVDAQGPGARLEAGERHLARLADGRPHVPGEDQLALAGDRHRLQRRIRQF